MCAAKMKPTEPLPDSGAIKKSMETAGQKSEMMQHVHDQLLKRMQEYNIQDNGDSRALLTSIEDLASMAKSIETHNVDGKAMIDSNYKELANHEVPQAIAAKAAEAFSKAETQRQSVIINFAISEGQDSAPEFLRGYTQAGEKLDQGKADSMDDLVNGMLDEHGLMSVNEEIDGALITRIYHKNREDGNRIPADAESVRKLFSEDLPAYMSSKGINVETIKRNHPKDRAPQQQQAQEQQQAAKADTQQTQQQPQEKKTEVEAPNVDSTKGTTTPGAGGGAGGGVSG